MTFILPLIILLSSPLLKAEELLPALFKASSPEQSRYCASPSLHKSSQWKKLMGNHIDSLVKKSGLTGIDLDIYKNQLVTLSYLELHQSENPFVHMMGYVYGNASHHLGRLVRFHYWQKFPEEELGKIDQMLISGNILGTTVRMFPLTLSKKLMSHSLELYKTLSWGLGAASICGMDYVRKMIRDESPELVKAFDARNEQEFAWEFVAFEQKFLQKTMYQEPLIKVPASLGVLDKMRFIPFNGIKTLSFFEWCERTDCKKTSLDLETRIEFDREIISDEIRNHSTEIKLRLKNSGIKNVSRFILDDYCRRGKIPDLGCR